MEAEKRTCHITDNVESETQICYTLERKRVKNINLRIRADGSVYVSASPRIAVSKIEEFITAKKAFILRTQARFRERQHLQNSEKQYVSGESFYLLGRHIRLCVRKSAQNRVFEDGVYLYLDCKSPDDFRLKKRLVEQFFKKQCEQTFLRLAEKIYPTFQKYGVPFSALKIRAMKSRWGSCIPSKRQITLNSALIHVSERCIEYVLAHEFCHFRYPNHSRQFYDWLTVIMPDWKERKAELEGNGV